jgi:hypothetical protein
VFDEFIGCGLLFATIVVGLFAGFGFHEAFHAATAGSAIGQFVAAIFVSLCALSCGIGAWKQIK